MSNPLKLIRQYSKVLLVVFGVMLMLAFVVQGTCDNYLMRRYDDGSRENPLVVTWTGHEIYESDIERMKIQRAIASQFLRALLERTRELKGFPGAQLLAQGTSDELLVYQYILANKAEKMGMVVDDQAVIDYLRRLTGGVLNDNDFQRVINEMQNNHRGVTVKDVFATLKAEMAANNLARMNDSGMFVRRNAIFSPAVVSPGQSWDYFNRLNRRVRAEVMPIAVDKFLDKVADPSESELRAFHKKYKDDYPNEYSPEPGFKEMHRVSFQFLQANFEDFLARAMEKVTEEQIVAEYEARKDTDYVRIALPQLPPRPDGEPQPRTISEDEVHPGDLPGGHPNDLPGGYPEDLPAVHPDDLPENRAAAKPGADIDLLEGIDEEETVVDDAPLEEPAESAEPDAETDSASPGEPQARADFATHQFVAFLDDGEAVEESPVLGDEATATEAEATAEDKTNESNESNEAAEAGEEVVEVEETVEEEMPAEGDPANGEPAAGEPAANEPIQYKPLDEVREQIRRRLANPEAQDAMTAAVREAQGVMATHYGALTRWRIDLKKDAKAPEPKAPDLKALAERLSLTYGSKTLVNIVDIQDEDVAMAASAIFQKGLPLFAPRIYPPMGLRVPNTVFVFWKTDEKEEFSPEFDDVKDKVLRAWKMQKALAIATEQANEIAGRLRTSGATLKDAYGSTPGFEVFETDQFSWYTGGDLPGGSSSVYIDPIENVDGAGREFRREVLFLDIGDVGVAPNAGHKIVYVIRVDQVSPGDSTRRTEFLESAITRSLNEVTEYDRRYYYYNWIKELEGELNLTWVRPPRQEGDGM